MKKYICIWQRCDKIADRRSPIAKRQQTDRRSIMISSSIFNEFAPQNTREGERERDHKQVTFSIWERQQQLKVKDNDRLRSRSQAQADRDSSRMRRRLTQFRFLMGCQRPLPKKRRRSRRGKKKKNAPSIFHLPIERTIHWSFQRLINSSLLCAIFGLHVLILSLDFHAQLMFMTSDCVAVITQRDSDSDSESSPACHRMLHIVRKLPIWRIWTICDLNLCLASCLTCENQILIDVMTAATESHSKSFPQNIRDRQIGSDRIEHGSWGESARQSGRRRNEIELEYSEIRLIRVCGELSS